ncbi:helix-turn-helix domain-containing protein [Malaciobacter mytili]|uniref:helix-turn-helix domain-containing protein n=1 Tax=Malaciobacter mytili TaxID=603050 RepID=UPI003BAE5273
MLNFEEIINRLIIILNLKNKSELALLMEVSTAVLANWKARNKIPYEQIVTICLKNNIDIKYILTGNVTDINTVNNQNNNSNSKILNVQGNNNHVNIRNIRDEQLKLLEELKKLPEKRQKYYFHIISAEALELEE